MATFDQSGQTIHGNQYNAGNDININSANSLPELIQGFMAIKAQISGLSGVKDISGDVIVDAEYEIDGAIKEAKKSQPDKEKMLSHVGKAKELFGDLAAAGGVVTALTGAAEALSRLL